MTRFFYIPATPHIHVESNFLVFEQEILASLT